MSAMPSEPLPRLSVTQALAVDVRTLLDYAERGGVIITRTWSDEPAVLVIPIPAPQTAPTIT